MASRESSRRPRQRRVSPLSSACSRSGDPSARSALSRTSAELIDVFHRPENRAIHDRLTERILVRAIATVELIVSDGIAEGQFAHQNPHLAAGFVLATFTSLHDLVGHEADVKEVASELTAFILRGLGYRGDGSR